MMATNPYKIERSLEILVQTAYDGFDIVSERDSLTVVAPFISP